MKKINILGVNLAIAKKTEIHNFIRAALFGHRARQIVTPNPEFLLAAQKDKAFWRVLNNADLAVPDGFGLKCAAWLKGVNLTRFPGSDLMLEILKLAEAQKARVAIVNRQDGLSSEQAIRQVLRQRFPKLNFVIKSLPKKDSADDAQWLKNFGPKILLVNFGAPEQDKFIVNIKDQLPSLKLAMGVGGSFDFLTNKRVRAPKLFRALGLEWLWRLLIQPKRIKRIFNAVIIFSLTAAVWRIRSFFYRPSIVAMIITPQKEVLLLNRLGPRDYWGLPQGGIDGLESAEQAAKRETFEETGLKNIKILASFKNIFKYRWPSSYTNSGYKGEKQTLFIISYNGPLLVVKVSPDEHKAYKWVRLDRLAAESGKVHETAYKLFLEKLKTVKDIGY